MRRKILSLVLSVALIVTAGTYGLTVGASQELVPGIAADDVWNFDRSGLYVANVPSEAAAGSVYRFSTTKNGYSIGEYKFYLYSGNFDQNSSFEGALYFFNNNPDTPAGNGISMRWGAGGIYMCDKNGNKQYDISENNVTIKQAWKADTWYYIVLYALGDGRIAMKYQVVSYDAQADSFTVTADPNGGTPYWPCRWDNIDPTMTQNSGYVHVTANTAIMGTVNTAYTTAIKGFQIAGYAKPSYTMPAPVLATGATLEGTPEDKINIGETGTISALIAPESATNKNIKWAVEGTSVTLTPNGNTAAYQAVASGDTTIKVIAGWQVIGQSIITVNAPVISPDRVKITKTGTDILDIGDTGMLAADVQPTNLTAGAVWNVVRGDSVTLGADGAFSAVKAGTTIVRCTVGDKYDEIALTVNGGVTKFEGLTSGSEKWVYSNTGFYVADANNLTQYRLSTTQNTYGFGEYQFKLFSGDLDSSNQYEAVLYFNNLSPDTPAGNGISLRFRKSGIALCDKAGNTVINITEDHKTIRDAWQPNTWYSIVLYVLSDGRIALNIKVLDYDEATDTFTVANALNNGNHYWPGNWSTADPTMPQDHGYVHFTVTGIEINGEKVPLHARIDDFAIAGYGKPSYTAPVFVPLNYDVIGENESWNEAKDTATIELSDNQSGSFQFVMENGNAATYPYIKVMDIKSNGVTVTHEGDGFGYASGAGGNATIKLFVGGAVSADGTVCGGHEVTVNLVVRVDATGLHIDGAPVDSVNVGTVGKLTAVLTPLNATSPVVWSVQGSSITIDADGNYRAVSNGVSTITATANNISDSVQIKVVNSGFTGMKMNSGIWVNSLNGLYVAGGDTDMAVLSTTANTYSFGEYSFKLFSGSFNEADFEGALYFFNNSPNVPQGCGISLRWNKSGLFICDSAGKIVYDMTYQFATIRYTWAPNTWYGITLYALSDGQLAFNFKVLSYNEATDSYTVATDPNNGKHYWPGNWTAVDSGMQQSSGYVHFTLNSAVVEGERKYYDAKIEDFFVAGYGGSSYTIPAFKSSELAISDHDIVWSRDKKTAYVYIDPDTSKDVALSIANFTQATYPQFRILNMESSGVTVTKLTEDSIRYLSGESGSGYVDLLIDFMELDDGTVVGGRQIRVVFEVQILATGITVIGVPETAIAFGAFGKLTAIIEPANATSAVKWSIAEGRGISIDTKGNYVAVCEGTATIRATIDGFTDEVTITVTDRVAVSDVDITGAPSQSISVGSTGQISANVNPANAYDNKAKIRVIHGRSVEFDQATGDYKAVRKGSTVVEVAADGIRKKFTIVVK